MRYAKRVSVTGVRGWAKGLVVILCAAFAAGGATPQEEKAAEANEKIVQAQMRNVQYHFSTKVAVHIISLYGELVPTGKNEFPVFDDKQSFILNIRSGELAISAVDLGNVLNTYVFSKDESPIGDASTSIEDGKFKMKGKLREKRNIPFEVVGTLSATKDGKVRMHPESIKALHLPVTGLMDFFGIEMGALVKTGTIPGVETEGNDMILDLEKVLPAPHIRGKVTGVRIDGDSIVQKYGRGGDDKSMKISQTGNYMAYRKNRLRFGKLTMSDTDLTLIDMDPNDPLDFYLDHYKEQLSAGYTKIGPGFGLKVYVKDFNKLGQARAAAKEAARNGDDDKGANGGKPKQ